MTTTDWASVGGDPTPGDVVAFDILARAFDRTAEDASDAQRSLERLASNVQSTIWEGEAADAFRDKIEELPPQLGKLHDSYDTASGALRSYGAVLADLKARAATALADAGAAEAEGTSSAQAAAQAVAADPEAPTAQYEQALANARQRLRGARDEIERIGEERKSAETRLVGRLSDAGDKGIQNERWGGLKRFLKAVGDACELIALAILVVAAVVIVVVALVALASNPAGWAVLAAGISAGLSTAGPLLTAVSVFGVAALGTKIGRLAVGDESVSKGSVALDVGLSLAGPAGKIGGRVFKRLSSGRRAVGGGDDALDAGRGARGGNAAAAAGRRLPPTLDDIRASAARLKDGKRPPVKVVDSVEELDDLYDYYSSGGEPVPSPEGFKAVRLPDGTRVQRRPVSKSKGPAIDVHPPKGEDIKIHIEHPVEE